MNNTLEIEKKVEYELDKAITMDELLSLVKEDIHLTMLSHKSCFYDRNGTIINT